MASKRRPSERPKSRSSARKASRPSRRPAQRTISEDPSGPKTTRPEAIARREPEPRRTAAQKLKRKLDAVPDRIDIRDWFYQPRLTYLPDQVVNCDLVPAILDQGSEGACTGYALAAVINYLLRGRNVQRIASPRMLYELARRYDEWPGEAYEGSSARGAMKGWVRHGVADVDTWPVDVLGLDHLQARVGEAGLTVADLAQRTPGRRERP